MDKQSNIANTSVELFKLLEPYSTEERQRIVQAATILLGDRNVSIPNSGNLTPDDSLETPVDAKDFFGKKDPKNKGEELAVAARYREIITPGTEEHSKAELKAVFIEARRNFDDKNFKRNMDNAKRQAGLFNLGTGRNAHKLSYQGQQFVDSLPNREIASKYKKKTKAKKKIVVKKNKK